jgi:hypothetical protein
LTLINFSETINLMLSNKGFSPLIVIFIIGLIALTIIGAKSYYNKAEVTASPEPSALISPSPSPEISPSPSSASSPKASAAAVTPSQTPQVDCTGPDGKKFKTTKAECDKFNKSWATPTPSPKPSATSTNSSSSSTSSSSGNCSNGSVNISLQPNNGSVVGDTLVRITVRSNDQGCSSGYSNETIMQNGQSSLSLGGLPPATYNLFVTYHGVQSNESFTISSGGSASKTVSVNY